MRLSWCIFATILSLATAHVQLASPPPIRSPKDPNASYNNIDYDYTAPLNPDGSNYPCKGYQTDTPVRVVASYQAGSSYNVVLSGSATHLGGSCQLSLSYDNGKTFKVIKSMIGGCPMKDSYNFTIPSSAPSGQALFAWTWLNFEGNREFYMNCAWVKIDGVSGGSLNSLPNLWVANIKGVTSCTTVEQEDPVFPHPGPDVEYGGHESSSSPKTPGNCEAGSSDDSAANSSPGMFFEAAAPTSSSAMVRAAAASSPPNYSSSAAPNSQVSHEPMVFAQMNAGVTSTSTSYSPGTVMTTVTIEESCSPLPDVTVTVYPSTVTIVPSSSTFTTSKASPQPATGTHPPYATDTSIYLPCIPGTFLCSSLTTFYTCGQASSGWTWAFPRTVADGMECLPFLSPMSSSGGTKSYGQEPGAPVGYYRDDRYVRYRPYGDCPVDGALQCQNGGSTFWICDQGGWVDMGSVAAGTTCVNGAIVAS